MQQVYIFAKRLYKPVTIIQINTNIYSSPEICFDLSRSVELHKISTIHTNESVVAGKATGLFEKGDTVKWRAKHFGIYQHLEMKITEMDFPVYFEDCMLKGIFKSITHKHYFKRNADHTIMTDEFMYKVPFGIAGEIFDGLFLKKYMTALLEKRNETIKQFAESERWKELF